MSKPKLQARLAALSFSEKIRILEKLRDRERAIAASGFRKREEGTVPIRLVACIKPSELYKLDNEGGYWSLSGDGKYAEKVARLCREFSLPYSEKFVSIAVVGESDDAACPEYGEPVPLNIHAILPLISIVCSDDIQDVADNGRGHEVLLSNVSNVTSPEKIKILEEAVARRSNAKYAEARIYVSLKAEHVEPGWTSKENDPITQAGLWPDEE